MFKIEPSFLQKLQFNEFDENGTKYTVGGYVYKDKNKNKNVFDVDVETIGGENKIKNRVVPVGLMLNNFNENLQQKQHSGNIGIIDIKLFNEFLDLNHKPISNLTRSRKNKLRMNTTKKNM